MRKTCGILLLMLVLMAGFAFGAEKGTVDMGLKIEVDGRTLEAVLYDNSSSHALVELLKKGDITIDMHDYGNFEKVGELPQSLPRNDTYTETDAGDLILYLGHRFVIYYDKNAWDFTPLGKVQGIEKKELKKLLGSGNVKAVLSLK